MPSFEHDEEVKGEERKGRYNKGENPWNEKRAVILNLEKQPFKGTANSYIMGTIEV